MTWYTFIPTPIGTLTATRDAAGLTLLALPSDQPKADPAWAHEPAAFDDLAGQLGEFFAGRRTAFTLPLAAHGTPFQRAVWDAVRAIPYGQRKSYSEVAREVGRPTAVRAVGAANARNPLPILVPCHRVVGTDGGLTGYAGGLELKRRLLDLENGIL